MAILGLKNAVTMQAICLLPLYPFVMTTIDDMKICHCPNSVNELLIFSIENPIDITNDMYIMSDQKWLSK